MSATRLAWVTALVSVAVVAGLAVAAFGVFSADASAPRSSDQSTAPSWYHGNSTNGTYAVSFDASGLPTGTFWSVEVRGAGSFWNGGGSFLSIGAFGWGGYRWNGSANATVTFALPNGTYDYSIGEARNGTSVYVASPSAGNLTVNGSSVSIAVAFSALSFFDVTFTESGLPAGTFWSATIHGDDGFGGRGTWDACGGGTSRGGFAWNGTRTTSLNFSEANGAYRFSVGPVWVNGTLYVADPSAGNVTVNGSSVSVSIAFAPPTLYAISFVETGLPNGTNWSVGISGGFGGSGGNRSSNSTIGFARPDGTYGFAVGAVWNSTGVYLADPHWGSVTVSGADVTVDVVFTFYAWGSWN